MRTRARGLVSPTGFAALRQGAVLPVAAQALSRRSGMRGAGGCGPVDLRPTGTRILGPWHLVPARRRGRRFPLWASLGATGHCSACPAPSRSRRSGDVPLARLFASRWFCLACRPDCRHAQRGTMMCWGIRVYAPVSFVGNEHDCRFRGGPSRACHALGQPYLLARPPLGAAGPIAPTKLAEPGCACLSPTGNGKAYGERRERGGEDGFGVRAMYLDFWHNVSYIRPIT